MKKHIITHRLKIVEQVIVVSLFSLIIPLIVTGIIVNNINRQALARELSKTAQILAQTVDNNIYDMFKADDVKINEIGTALKYIYSDKAKQQYLDECFKKLNIFSSLKIETYKGELPDFLKETPYLDSENGNVIVSSEINKNQYVVGIIKPDHVQSKIFRNIEDTKRQIYVLSGKNQLIFSLNYDNEDFDFIMKNMPKGVADGAWAYIEDKTKENQPIIYRKMIGMDTAVIVNTTKEITEKIIYKSAWKIFTAMLVSTIASILFIILYTYYLYINIRQLFKGIIALSKGNYSRQIRLLKNVFTPFELVFLANEFNKAAEEINLSYSRLEKQNNELEILDNFRSNLIDTVSHEFRTPLTSIMGYTSRLMRKDIVIDEETLNKSLRIIKQQCSRLSRMVEDLLVIPDIEGARLNISPEMINLSDVLETSVLSVRNIEKRQIINHAEEKELYVYADKDRFEQVLINLIENANKYGLEDTPLEIDAVSVKGKTTVILKNNAEYIDKKTLNKLFDKFTRLDDKTTRTTRGTGLGLFIVKGLLKAMNGNIFLKSTVKNEFYTYVVLPSEEKAV